MTAAPSSNINIPYSPFIDEATGRPAREWLLWLMNPKVYSFSTSAPLQPSSGGTGLSATPTNGQLLIGNGSGYTLNTLTVGSGLSEVNGAGTITLANTGVLSFNASGTGLTPAAATTGDVSLSGTLNAAHGGTGLTTYTVGDLLVASGATALAKLSDVATGNVLLSGGVGASPSYGKVNLTLHVTGILPEANGGTNQSTYAKGDMLYASAANTLSKLAAPANASYMTINGSGVPSWKYPAAGAFVDTTTHTAAANTPTPITINTTQVSQQIAVGATTSQVIVSKAGTYSITFSIQLTNSSASIDTNYVWMRVNGTDAANTNSTIDVNAKHGSINGSNILCVNLFYTFAAGDYFEIVWMTLGGTTTLTDIPASAGPPAYPASPSFILTISDNITV